MANTQYHTIDAGFNTLHDAIDTPLSAASNGTTLALPLADGWPVSEVLINVSTFPAGRSATFTLQDDAGGSLATTGLVQNVTAAGVYKLMFDNFIVKGKNIRLVFTPSGFTGGETSAIHAHVRPYQFPC
jgi:hypothetical protein